MRIRRQKEGEKGEKGREEYILKKGRGRKWGKGRDGKDI